MSTPASEESIIAIKQNVKDIMTEYEKVFPGMMDIRHTLETINTDNNKPNEILNLLTSVEDLSIGSHFIMHELMASFELLLDSNILYEKRFHIENINLSICEAFNCFVGNKNNGVWSSLKPYINALDNSILNSYIIIIDNELNKLETEHCNIELRKSTAHYDKPIIRYNILDSITDENVFCKAVSQFMLIHMRINQLSTIIFAIITQITPRNTIHCNEPKKEIFDINNSINTSLGEQLFSNELLKNTSDKSLSKISDNINSLYNNSLFAEKANKFIESQEIKSPTNINIMKELVLIRMMINFIRCDLICTVKAYINSKSNIERALHLRKIYLTEVSALTHLYGYNEEKNKQSLWEQLMILDNDKNEEEIISIVEEFKTFTLSLDNTRRNLNTHFREKEKLNVVERYDNYNILNHIDELKNALKILNLCKKIDSYTFSVFKRMEEKQNLESKKLENQFTSIFENVKDKILNSKLEEDNKQDLINKFKDSNEKLLSIFKNK